jgi:hypothetical protein
MGDASLFRRLSGLSNSKCAGEMEALLYTHPTNEAARIAWASSFLLASGCIYRSTFYVHYPLFPISVLSFPAYFCS